MNLLDSSKLTLLPYIFFFFEITKISKLLLTLLLTFEISFIILSTILNLLVGKLNLLSYIENNNNIKTFINLLLILKIKLLQFLNLIDSKLNYV